jgi:hypothetical protein
MAKIRDYAITTEAVAVTSMVCAMPTHETGDLLVAFVNKNGTTLFTTPSGWTADQTQASTGAGGGVYTKRAASSSETVTFALGSNSCCAVVLAVQNVNGSTESDAVSGSAKSGANDLTLPLTGVGITPGHDNCLVLHGLSTDGGGGFNALPPWVNLFSGDTVSNSLAVSYTQQKTAAAITAPDHWGGVADDSRGFIIAVRDDGNGDVFDGYIPLGAAAPARQISPMNGSSGGVVDKGTWALAGAGAITSVNGVSILNSTIGFTADSGINPYRASARIAGAQSKTTYNCSEINLTAADDITDLNGLVFFTFTNLTASDYKDCGTVAQGGKYVLLGSTSADYRAWKIGGFRSATEVSDARNNVLIEYSTTDTDLATLGTPDFSALDLIQFGSMGYAAACTLLVNELYVLNVVTLAGGTDTSTLGLTDLVFVVNNGCGILPLVQRAGVQATLWVPLVFGGVDPLFFVEDKKTFAYPQKADGTSYMDFHVSNNKVGIEFNGQDRGSGDVDILHFTDCLFTSPSSYYWRFASGHDAGADITFAGSSVINAAVTLRSTVSLSNVTFIDCGSFTQNNAALTSCRFTDTTITSDNPADISDCAFASSGTGHAIEITTAGTYTLDGNTFTGYAGTNGSTGNESVYNNSGGAVTLNVAGGVASPTIRDGVGASTTVNNSVSVTLTGLKDTTEVRVYAAGTTTPELAGTDDATDGTSGNRSFTFTLPASTSVDVRVFNLGYEPADLLAYAVPAVTTSVPISQQVDRWYINP